MIPVQFAGYLSDFRNAIAPRLQSLRDSTVRFYNRTLCLGDQIGLSNRYLHRLSIALKGNSYQKERINDHGDEMRMEEKTLNLRLDALKNKVNSDTQAGAEVVEASKASTVQAASESQRFHQLASQIYEPTSNTGVSPSIESFCEEQQDFIDRTNAFREFASNINSQHKADQ